MQGYGEIIAAVLGGGTLSALVQVWRENTKIKSNETLHILDTYKSMLADLRKEEIECKKQIRKNTEDIAELQEQIINLKKKLSNG